METKFKTEITEINETIISNSKESAPASLFDIESKDTVISTPDTRTNNNGSESGISVPIKKTETPTDNENSSEGKKDEATKVETRGRKSLTDDEKKQRADERAKGEPTNKKAAQTSLIDDLSKYKTNTTASPTANVTNVQASPEIDLSKYVSGALLLIVIDSCFPALILMIAGFVDKKYKNVDKKLLKLTNEEKKELEPLANEIIKLMFGMVHPAIAFLVATGMMYAGKLMSLDDEDFEDSKKIVVNAKKK